MSLKDKISQDLKEAMKSKDAIAVGSLRLIIAAVKNREIEKGGELSDDEFVKVLMSQAKQRDESIESYKAAGRNDLADKEIAELGIIKRYLPEQLSEEDVAKLVEEIVAEVGANSMKDMGKVMKVLSARAAGRADGKRLSEIVKKKLEGK